MPRRERHRSRRSRSLRQLFARLLRHHVGGVPVWPVRVALPGALLVLALGCPASPKRARQIVRRCEGCRRVLDATGKPRRDFLEQPAVPVRIAERGERAVAAMLGIRTVDPGPPKQVGLVWAGVHVVGAVEHFADLNAATEQILARGLDVSDDQIKALNGAGSRPGDVLAEDDRAPGAKWRELNHAKVLTVVVVGVESPPEPRVELRGTT